MNTSSVALHLRFVLSVANLRSLGEAESKGAIEDSLGMVGSYLVFQSQLVTLSAEQICIPAQRPCAIRCVEEDSDDTSRASRLKVC